jgi:hypothetical protein
MRKFIIAGMAVAMLALPAASMAAQPMSVNPNAPAGQDTLTGSDEFNGGLMGFYNSRVIHNGSYISAQAHELGGRGPAVQDTLGHTK